MLGSLPAPHTTLPLGSSLGSPLPAPPPITISGHNATRAPAPPRQRLGVKTLLHRVKSVKSQYAFDRWVPNENIRATSKHQPQTNYNGPVYPRDLLVLSKLQNLCNARSQAVTATQNPTPILIQVKPTILPKYFVNKMINSQTLKRLKSNDDEIRADMIDEESSERQEKYFWKSLKELVLRNCRII